MSERRIVSISNWHKREKSYPSIRCRHKSQVTETDLWARTSTTLRWICRRRKIWTARRERWSDRCSDNLSSYALRRRRNWKRRTKKKKKTFSGHQSFGINWPKRKNSAGHLHTESELVWNSKYDQFTLQLNSFCADSRPCPGQQLYWFITHFWLPHNSPVTTDEPFNRI